MIVHIKKWVPILRTPSLKSAAASVQLQARAYTTLRPTWGAFGYDFANLLFQGLVLT